MIARVWYGAVPAHRADAYAAYLSRTGINLCLATPGNRGVQVLRRVSGDQAEFVFLSFWDSVEAVTRFGGESAAYYPEDKDELLALTPDPNLYEVVGEAPPRVPGFPSRKARNCRVVG